MSPALRLLAGAAAAGLSFAAFAQPAPQAQGASQQGAATGAAAQDSSDASATATVKPVTSADVKAGATINDPSGNPVAKVQSVSGKTAIIASGSAKASVSLSSLGRNDKGLVIAMTKSQFEAAAKANSSKKD